MEINKARSTSVKDFLYNSLSKKLNIPSATIEKVIQHSFENMSANMKSKNSVEIAGFGKFLFNLKKAQKRVDKLKAMKEVLEKKLAESPNDEKLQYKVETTSQTLTTLENRCLK